MPKPLTPATGLVAVLNKPLPLTLPTDSFRVLIRVKKTADDPAPAYYEVHELFAQTSFVKVQPTGSWTDPEANDVTIYHQDLDGRCNCPDAEYRPDRPGGCKHQRILRLLLKMGKI